MRLVLVSRRYPPAIGGAERVLSYLAPALAAEGAEVTVLTSRLDDSPPLEVAPGPRSGPGSLRVERLATSPLRFVGTIVYLRNLRRWFRRHPVDLAYVSMLKHDAFATLGAGHRLGFPVVLRPEGAGATGDIAWQNWGRGGRAIARRCRRADAFVAISPAVRAELVADGYPAGRIVALPNGVPIPLLAWTPPPGPPGALRVVTVGRLSVEKGADVLVRAWLTVRAEIPEARLTLVGDGPERPRLTALIAELGLGGSVDLPGAMADPLVELRRSDLFVLPSREEGMSIALLEAMALGIPLVATSIPGNSALVDPDVHGRLAPPDDPAALARVIVAHHRNPVLGVTWGRAARERATADYSITAVARRHLALFEDVRAAHAGRRGL